MRRQAGVVPFSDWEIASRQGDDPTTSSSLFTLLHYFERYIEHLLSDAFYVRVSMIIDPFWAILRGKAGTFPCGFNTIYSRPLLICKNGFKTAASKA